MSARDVEAGVRVFAGNRAAPEFERRLAGWLGAEVARRIPAGGSHVLIVTMPTRTIPKFLHAIEVLNHFDAVIASVAELLCVIEHSQRAAEPVDFYFSLAPAEHDSITSFLDQRDLNNLSRVQARGRA